MHQIDLMKKEQAMAVLVDFCHFTPPWRPLTGELFRSENPEVHL